MDPYLEEARLWADFHQALLYSIRAQLTTLLPEGFVATLGERLYLESVDRAFYADAAVLEVGRPQRPGRSLALAEAPLEILLTPEEIREPFIEILEVRGRDESVVTVIELLSPKNKEAGAGRREYLAKQSQLLASEVNLLEIDLLRGGQDVLAVPRALLRSRATCDYALCLHRAGSGPAFGCWPLSLRDALPATVTVPLTPTSGGVSLDLAQAFLRTYDEGGYSRRIDYQMPPPKPPLSDEDTQWMEKLLQ